jgi:hypothetical protein
VSVFERLRMPPLGGASEWLNSEPLAPAELRGHVVLVNFWTLTCINWLRTEPYVRAWSQAYRDAGAHRYRDSRSASPNCRDFPTRTLQSRLAVTN